MSSLNDTVDVVFAGLGASACVLIHELHQNGWMTGKSIVILEPSEKSSNDRTFCFWDHPDGAATTKFSSIIDKSWMQVNMNGRVQSIAPLRYNHIQGIDLYRTTLKILEEYNVRWISCLVSDIATNGSIISCKTDQGQITGTYCFDSRPPAAWQPADADVALIQSFYGLRIRISKDLNSEDYATLMDFDVDQCGTTQFIYRLPLSQNEILIELTRFSDSVLESDHAHQLLLDWIKPRYGTVEIIEIEQGRIPMEHGRPACKPVSKNHIVLGTRAGKVKASTGYAFKNMVTHASTCADQLLNQASKKTAPRKSNRFGFYDHLLLIILKHWPTYGSMIFRRLLDKQNAGTILTFLDEKTTLRQEISIFSKLPIWIFVRALTFREWHMLKRCSMEWFTLTGSAVASIAFLLAPDLSYWILSGILIAGLILIGIPHGAVDDLLNNKSTVRFFSIRFIGLYLLQGMIMIGMWLIQPTLALWIFLLYSAWHFGQADRANEHGTSEIIRPLLQGAAILTVILLTHIPELNAILGQLRVHGISNEWTLIAWITLAASALRAWITGDRRNLLGFATIGLTTTLPLLHAFGIYFIFQHSLRSWNHLSQSLNKTYAQLFRLALPFHIGAWILLGMLYMLNQNHVLATLNFGPVGLFFVFLSSLSFPHVLAMHQFYRNPKSSV